MPSPADGAAASNLAWLLSLGPWPERFGLERMQALLAELGHPERAFRSIHVVGTNGKTTTTKWIEALLVREGLDAGATISPHVRGWSERISVNGAEADLERALGRVRAAAEGVGATQFEVITAAAFSEFAAAGIEVAAVEAGLGGRYDATNVLASPVVVLTNVALEHTQWLGPTRAAIAGEKLAVIAPGAAVVLGEGEWEPLAREAGAGSVTVVSQDELSGKAVELVLGRDVQSGAVEPHIPGRLEWRSERELWDGAHNPAGIVWLVERLPKARWTVVCSILADKDASLDAQLAGSGLGHAGGDAIVQPPRAPGERAGSPGPRALRERRGDRRSPAGTRQRSRARLFRELSPRHRLALLSCRSCFCRGSCAQMKNASHGVTAFLVLTAVVVAVLGIAFGIGYLVGKLVI